MTAQSFIKWKSKKLNSTYSQNYVVEYPGVISATSMNWRKLYRDWNMQVFKWGRNVWGRASNPADYYTIARRRRGRGSSPGYQYRRGGTGCHPHVRSGYARYRPPPLKLVQLRPLWSPRREMKCPTGKKVTRENAGITLDNYDQKRIFRSGKLSSYYW